MLRSARDHASPTAALGSITAIRGNVVDVRFEPPLPPRNNELRTGPGKSVVLEVQTHVAPDMTRCIALNAARQLSRGMAVTDMGHTLRMPVGEALLGRMLNVFS